MFRSCLRKLQKLVPLTECGVGTVTFYPKLRKFFSSFFISEMTETTDQEFRIYKFTNWLDLKEYQRIIQTLVPEVLTECWAIQSYLTGG
jgi:hypothetical protein